MYLTESERKRIKALYEASTASGAGSYEIPMGFESERPEIVGELPDEMDMSISDDEGISMDVDELMDMLGLSEEEDKKRMRQLHKDNSVVVEQEIPDMPDIPKVCSECLEKAIPEDLRENADEAVKLVYKLITTGEVDFGEAASTLRDGLMSILKVNLITAGKIAWDMHGCIDECVTTEEETPI